MPKLPLNFFQQSGWGVNPDGTDVLDFFTGLYLPQDLEGGFDVGFLWSTPGGPIQNTTQLSGALVDANPHTASLSSQYYGRLYPLIKESGFLAMNMTGALVSYYPDYVSFQIGVTSKMSGANIESGRLSVVLSSGNIVSGSKDINNLSSQFTGAWFYNTGGAIGVSCGIRGGFASPDRGNAFLGMTLYEISYTDDDTSVVNTSAFTGIGINMNLYQIAYSDN